LSIADLHEAVPFEDLDQVFVGLNSIAVRTAAPEAMTMAHL
jgi:hypothetical protein